MRRSNAVAGAASGVAGGAVMLAAVAVPGVLGRRLPVDVVRFWRGVTGRGDAAVAAHVALSAAAGVVYANVLGSARRSIVASVRRGAAAGVIHWVLAMSCLPALLRRFPATLSPALPVRTFGRGLGGLAMTTALVAHVCFGATTSVAHRALVR
jgi:hypothetical protein